MDFTESLLAIRNTFILMAIVLLVEAIAPLYRGNVWNKRHLGPNLVAALVTFALGTALNLGLLFGLIWLEKSNLGLLNMMPPVSAPIEILIVLVVLDFAWYLTHRSMHKYSSLWRFHAVHHSDLAVDVTTTYRQHPGEGIIRYAFLTTFAFAIGASPAAFAFYRLWSVFAGQAEHANVRIPQWLDTPLSWITMSPVMHKVHHSRDPSFTDTNYSQIFSFWDRLFGTCTPARYGRDIDFGLNGFDDPEDQSALGLMAMPFRNRANRFKASDEKIAAIASPGAMNS